MVWSSEQKTFGRLALLALLAGAAHPAAAQAAKIFCCEANGHRVCGDHLPAECSARAHREMTSGGAVKEVAAPLTPEQKAQQAAEQERKKKEDEKLAEAKRRDATLLATYANEQDIDTVRDRQVAEAQNSLKAAQDHYAKALEQKRRLDGELEFYRNKPVPPKLANQIRENQADMVGQQAAVAARKQEVEDVRARFEEDKARYRQLTAARAPAR